MEELAQTRATAVLAAGGTSCASGAASSVLLEVLLLLLSFEEEEAGAKVCWERLIFILGGSSCSREGSCSGSGRVAAVCARGGDLTQDEWRRGIYRKAG